MKRNGMLLCFVGPSGGGKTTYANRLLKDDSNFSFSVSLTTRPPRDGEKNGESYEFVSRDVFMQAVKNNELFEWEEVHGNCYGTRLSSVENALKAGRDLLLDIDIKGAFSFKRGFPQHTVVVFLTPPSADVLKERLKARAAISEEEFLKRLNTAQGEFASLLEAQKGDNAFSGMVDYFLINNSLDETYQQILSIVTAERCKLKRLDRCALENICKI